MATVPLALVCAIDFRYGLPLLVLLRSLRTHLSPRYQPVLYLIHQGLPPDLIAAISRSVETHLIFPDAKISARLPRGGRFPPEAAYPLLLAELLPPSLERALFLDADILVLDDLAALWETPLEGRTIAAAPDTAIRSCGAMRGVKNRKEFGVPDGAAYFNCGILLIDLAAWRDRDVTGRANHYLERVGPRVDFLHQEALNAVLWNDVVNLDPRWNLPGSLPGEPSSSAPGIVHFAGRFKPWRIPVGGPYNGRYRGFLSQVAPEWPAEKPTSLERIYSVYDRHFRKYLFRLEKQLWEWRLI